MEAPVVVDRVVPGPFRIWVDSNETPLAIRADFRVPLPARHSARQSSQSGAVFCGFVRFGPDAANPHR